MMSRKGQASIFSVIFIIIIFLIIFGVALAPIVTTTMGVAVESSGETGIGAFIMDNFLLWIIIAFLIFILWMVR